MQTTDTRPETARDTEVVRAVRAALRADEEAGPDYLAALHDRVMARVQFTATTGVSDVQDAPANRYAPLILGLAGVTLVLIALMALARLR
jgi:hypothetical protein